MCITIKIYIIHMQICKEHTCTIHTWDYMGNQIAVTTILFTSGCISLPRHLGIAFLFGIFLIFFNACLNRQSKT